MKITVAKTAGFCMGVRRAVDMVLDASNCAGEPIFTYGPLIHNPQVLEMLENKKIFRFETIPEKGEGIVLIRAHGVPPEDELSLEKAGFTVLNATCPRVVSVQVIINRYAKKGYATIIIGDKKHPEVVGLLGYARGNGYTITSMEQLKTLPAFENAVVVAQTTQNTVFYEQIKAWCARNAPHYKIFNTICGSTEKRQSEVRQLAQKNDAVIVVGGKQSGNTRRLVQVAKETGTLATLIEDASQIDYKALESAKSIAITAGASTPNWIINDTCAKVAYNVQKQRPIIGVLVQIRDFLLKSNLLLAGGAGGLTYACAMVQDFSQILIHSAVAMLYVLSMQILNNIITIKSDTYNHPERAVFYKNHQAFLRVLALGSGAGGLYLAYTTGFVSFCILLVMSLLGLSYNLKSIPVVFGNSKITRIKDIPGSKTILIAIAWGIVTSLLPAIANSGYILPGVTTFVFSTGLVFARTAFFDVLAIQGDRITGKETLPILLGPEKSFSLIQYVLAFNIFILIFAYWTDLFANNAFLLAFVPLFMLLLIRLHKKDSLLSGRQYEFLIESSFLFAGVVAAII
ncbi:MAG: 4-hydroxy-3-methylbut-2-enyl diphosphate reductase [Desulfobacteraceae bacterium]|nr:4-hydroxy-3-methylbut-2-enyl diphosphate reductase [Desulfobacteraceae bacterium]